MRTIERPPTAVSLFAGCGGSDLGASAAGVVPIWANERDPVAVKVYRRFLPDAEMVEGDIRDVRAFPKADLLIGCYPCQGFSQGGARAADADLNFLYREFDRALRSILPKAFVVENVDGLRFKHNAPRLRAQLVRFRSAGYRVKYAVLDASLFGVPQRRRRLFLVGIRSDMRREFEFPTPTTPKPRTMRDAIWHLRGDETQRVNREPFHWYYLSRNRRQSWDAPAACVVAHWRHTPLHPDSPALRKLGKDQWEFSTDGPARRLSLAECAILQGFPCTDPFADIPLRAAYRIVGNAVPPPLFTAVMLQVLKTISPRRASDREVAPTRLSTP